MPIINKLLFILLIALSACTTTRSKNFNESFSLYPILHEKEPNTYAGSYVTDSSCYCKVFLFTDTPQERLSQYTDNPDFAAKIADNSLIKLREVLAQTKEQAEALGKPHWRRWGVGIDMKCNCIILDVWDVEEAKRKFDEAGIKLHPLVKLKWLSIDEV